MIKDALSGLKTAFLQWGINFISDKVFYFKKQEAIRLCKEFNCKYYVIQNGYFSWTILRAGDIDLYKRKGIIAKSVTAIELGKIAAYVAIPGGIL